jgi:hypothetical protein
MKQTIYTLISYIPGEECWFNRCGDHHNGEESALNIQYFTDKKSTGEAMAQAKLDNEKNEFTILVNGLNEDISHIFLSEEEQSSIEYDSSYIKDIADFRFSDLQEIKLNKEEQDRIEKKQKEKKEQDLRQQKDLESLEQEELAQLAKLQAKYNNL